jgi:hypothetical protein
MANRIKIAWSRKPKDDDYSAAENYLSLVFDSETAADLTQRLRNAPITRRVARDILRAAGNSMVGISDSDEERKKILAGEEIAPLLLVRHGSTGLVIVADGFHRLCTVYEIDPTAMVPCKIV